jgi:F-type H+-transporting ATPase subunit b
MEALGINLGYLIMQILGIIVLLLLLKAAAFGPILRVLDERKARIAKGLEDARQAAIARDNADAEAKKILDAARADAAKIRSEAAMQAEDAASGIMAKANEDAKAVVSAARTDAEAERNRILAELRGQVAAIAIAAANRIVAQSLDETRHRALITDFFARVPAGVATMRGARAEVTSALPLTDEEKQTATKALHADDIVFKVNPSILGGLIVRVGDQVVDDSVAGQMNALRDSLR